MAPWLVELQFISSMSPPGAVAVALATKQSCWILALLAQPLHHEQRSAIGKGPTIWESHGATAHPSRKFRHPLNHNGKNTDWCCSSKIFRSAAMLLKQRLRTLHFQSATNRRQSPATTEGARAGAVDEMTSADLRLRFVTSNRLLSFPLGFQSVPLVQNTSHESDSHYSRRRETLTAPPVSAMQSSKRKVPFENSAWEFRHTTNCNKLISFGLIWQIFKHLVILFHFFWTIAPDSKRAGRASFRHQKRPLLLTSPATPSDTTCSHLDGSPAVATAATEGQLACRNHQKPCWYLVIHGKQMETASQQHRWTSPSLMPSALQNHDDQRGWRHRGFSGGTCGTAEHEIIEDALSHRSKMKQIIRQKSFRSPPG